MPFSNPFEVAHNRIVPCEGHPRREAWVPGFAHMKFEQMNPHLALVQRHSRRFIQNTRQKCEVFRFRSPQGRDKVLRGEGMSR